MEGVAGNWGTVWRLQRTRREVLRAARSFTAAYSVSSVGGAFARGEETEKPVPVSLAQLDRALRDATLARQVPGVVAMAATNDGIIYEGAFGSRHLGQGPAMSYDTVFRIASMIINQSITNPTFTRRNEEKASERRSGFSLEFFASCAWTKRPCF